MAAFSNPSSSTTNVQIFRVGNQNQNQMTFYGIGMAQRRAFPDSVGINRWMHLAISRESGLTRVFVDGVSVGSFTDSNNFLIGFIGALKYGSVFYHAFRGAICGYRVTAAARYTSNFTRPSWPLPVGSSGDPFWSNVRVLLNFNDSIQDSSGNRRHATLAGSATFTTQLGNP